MKSIDHLIRETIPTGSSEYYSLYSQSPETKKDALILKTFILQIKNIASNNNEPLVADNKSNWWLDEVERLFEQKATHPICIALWPIIQKYDLAKETMIDFINAIKINCQYQAYHKSSELIQHCHRASHSANLLQAKLFCFTNPQSLQFIHDLGIGLELIYLIRHLYHDAQRGCILLPTEDLEKFDLTVNDILSLKTNDKIISLIKYQVNRAEELFKQAFAKLPAEDAYSLRGFIIQYALATKILAVLKKDNYPVLTEYTRLPVIKKLWIARSTVKRIKKNTFLI